MHLDPTSTSTDSTDSTATQSTDLDVEVEVPTSVPLSSSSTTNHSNVDPLDVIFAPTLKELGQILQVSVSLLHKLKRDKSMPGRTSRGYNVVQWRIALVGKGVLQDRKLDSVTKADLEKEKISYQIEVLKLNLEQARGKWIEKAKYESDIVRLCQIFASNLPAIPKSIGAFTRDPKVQDKAEAAVRDVLELVKREVSTLVE